MADGAASDVIRDGLAAWGRGDLDGLEAVLDPYVTFRAMQPGPWDCENRDQVMSLLRQREASRPDEHSRDVEVRRIDETTFVASGFAGGDGVATRVTVNGGKVISMQQVSTDEPDPDAEVAVVAIQEGNSEALARVLATRPDLACIRVPGYRGRTMLHIATDWPANYDGIAATIGLLVSAGANPNARGLGDHPETPLHWAASSHDVAALDAMLDAGADIDATGAVIGNGTPLNDATAFGQWHAARRLVERGATVSAWDAAALGLTEEVRRHIETGTDTSSSELLWTACHGGQAETAAYLLDEGADINWVGYDDLTPLGAAERSDAAELAAWLRNHGARAD
jgi:ketosteroid isomerase-like protein